ncbi:Cytochrome P450 monooxygenase nodJ-like protein [Cladobotryum mycophilum]|uniref:Cytochrome P450 monooxygenase nodJ-like protein n=1 Tax=Cladobotryum mycophilum TaxID=491253 RepID=A0ABR0S9I5_9HYPO
MDAFRKRTLDSGPVAWLVVGVAILVVLHHVLKTPRDSREPPYIQSKIPVIGHLIGIFRNGANYFNKLDEEYKQGLYALPFLRGRMYIVGSADWSTAVQKHDSTVDLYTLTSQAMQKLFCMDDRSMEIVLDNLYGEKGHTSSNIIHAVNEVMFKSLAPGKDLDELNHNILTSLELVVNGIAGDGKTEKLMLWDFTRRRLTGATMMAVYGPENPFAKYASFFDDFWLFDSSAAALMMVPYPSILARKAYQARRRVLDGWIDYARQGDYKKASALIQVRASECLAHGLTIDQYGLEECRFVPGLLTNTAPASFWLVSWIFQDAQLLADIRAEIDECIVPGEGNKRIINMAKLKAQCPLFTSTFLETLRIVSPLNNYRYVREDTMVTNNATEQTHLLKKGSMVQLATTVLHGRLDVWGEDVDSFNPSRFIPSLERARSMKGGGVDPASPFRDAKGKLHSGSYRPFGGGVHMCPGRHFAQTGIQALVALFIAGFEMESEPGTGRYVAPPFGNAKGYMFLSVIQPPRDVEVSLRRRDGYEDVKWEFEM